MATTLQIQASRDNGAMSQGPATEAGKQASSRNALRHGLCARKFELRNEEDQAAFDRLEGDLVFTWRAVEEAQKLAVRQLAVAMWREQTINAMEQALMDAIVAGEADAQDGGAGLPSMNSIYRYRGRIERDLKTAKAHLQELQAERVKAFEAKIAKAREFNSLTMLKDLRQELGDVGMNRFVADVTNEPKPEPAEQVQSPQTQESQPNTSPDTSGMNRSARRRAEKLAQKQAKSRTK